MIWLNKVDGSAVLVNADHIVWIEVAHDSIVSLLGGDRIRVSEAPEEIVRRVVDWRRRIGAMQWLEDATADREQG